MHGPHDIPRPDLLSARQVQQMLQVDRSTVYRMAEDGRLPAIKVGRQWRFPADRIDAVLQVGGHRTPARTAAPGGATDPGSASPLSADVAAAVTQLAADLLGVMMVVTDLDGRPITGVANPCDWFAARSDDPTLLDACVAEWQQLADDPDFEPHFTVGALGFECARTFVRVEATLVAMVLVGGVAPPGSRTEGLYHLDGEGRRRVLSALPRVAAALSRVAPREPRTVEGRSAP